MAKRRVFIFTNTSNDNVGWGIVDGCLGVKTSMSNHGPVSIVLPATNPVFLLLFIYFIVDVVDLAWSPDGRHLASCGLDRSVLIWETDNFGTFYLFTIIINYIKYF